ncbi:hypothetical protein [Candidatus Hartigia pinicola]
MIGWLELSLNKINSLRKRAGLKTQTQSTGMAECGRRSIKSNQAPLVVKHRLPSSIRFSFKNKLLKPTFKCRSRT